MNNQKAEAGRTMTNQEISDQLETIEIMLALLTQQLKDIRKALEWEP